MVGISRIVFSFGVISCEAFSCSSLERGHFFVFHISRILHIS